MLTDWPKRDGPAELAMTGTRGWANKSQQVGRRETAERLQDLQVENPESLARLGNFKSTYTECAITSWQK